MSMLIESNTWNISTTVEYWFVKIDGLTKGLFIRSKNSFNTLIKGMIIRSTVGSGKIMLSSMNNKWEILEVVHVHQIHEGKKK